MVSLSVVMSLALHLAFASASQTQVHWNYNGPEGPDEWGKLDPSYAACSAGKTQSPLDIHGAKRADLPALQFSYKSVPLSIVDNGHTIQVNYPAGSTLTVGTNVYTLQQFHFHAPSEENVNGHGYDMVVHLVHADAAGHLAVVAVFLNAGTSNPLLHVLWQNLPTEKGSPNKVSAVLINAKNLLPADRAYYTFSGSLTTPPCSEGVTWYVLKKPITLSPKQLADFTKLYPHNARPIQPTNGREILESQ